MKTNKIFLILLLLAGISLEGCVVGMEAKKMRTETVKAIEETRENEPAPAPIIMRTPGSWLMGQAVKVSPPLSPILASSIVYHPAQKVSLHDIAAHITSEKGLLIDVSETQTPTQSTATDATSLKPAPMPNMSSQNNYLPTPQQLGIGGAIQSKGNSENLVAISYEGTVAGLLDIAANKAGVWWKYSDGKVFFYRTETKTFYLPTNSRKSAGNSTIATNGGSSSSSTSASSSNNNSGTSITSDYEVDIWSDIAKTAKAVGNGAQIVANKSAGSITVTGTPYQVKAVEEWVIGLIEQLSQQVAITVHVYRVRVSNEENYNWEPSIVFKKTLENCGLCLTPGSSQMPESGATPVGLVVGVLPTAKGALGKISGSQAAFNALSTLGNVSETLRQTVVTRNGEPAPIQIANQQDYLASSATSQIPNVGTTTTLTPGSITVGFTATFLPRIINGKIILDMTMTDSSSNGFTSIQSGGSSIMMKDVDLNTFQHSVTLTPGDALLLAGLQQDKSKTSNRGVGFAGNALLGGGVNNNTDKSMIAIVVSAKVL